MSDLEIYWAHERGKLVVGLCGLAAMVLCYGILWVWFTAKERLAKRRKGLRPPAAPMPPKPPREQR